MWSLVVALALSQASTEPLSAQRGEAVELDELRARPRVKGAIAAQVGPLFVPFATAFNSPSSWGWVGLSGEVGATLNDRLSLGLRGGVLTPLFGAFDLSAVIGLDYALSDRFAIGAGAGARITTSPLFSFLSMMVPVRISFAPWTRKPTDLGRSGLLIGLELSGGVVTATLGSTARLAPAVAASAALSVGYAWW